MKLRLEKPERIEDLDLRYIRQTTLEKKAIFDQFLESGETIMEVVFGEDDCKTVETIRSSMNNAIKRFGYQDRIVYKIRKGKAYLVRKGY